MATIQIKHVPPDVHAELRRRADDAGQSLQEFMLALVRVHASRPTIGEVWRDLGEAAAGGPASPIGFAEAIALRDSERPAD